MKLQDVHTDINLLLFMMMVWQTKLIWDDEWHEVAYKAICLFHVIDWRRTSEVFEWFRRPYNGRATGIVYYGQLELGHFGPACVSAQADQNIQFSRQGPTDPEESCRDFWKH